MISPWQSVADYEKYEKVSETSKIHARLAKLMASPTEVKICVHAYIVTPKIKVLRAFIVGHSEGDMKLCIVLKLPDLLGMALPFCCMFLLIIVDMQCFIGMNISRCYSHPRFSPLPS